MNCYSRNIILAWLKGECPDSDRSDLEVHLSDCPVCQRQLAELCEQTALPGDTSAAGDWSDEIASRLARRLQQSLEQHAPDEYPLPRHVGDYELQEEIGRGGMGTVYRAQHGKLDRTVAVKLISRQFSRPGLVERFHAEARAAAALDHPGIVPVYDVGSSGRCVYLAMALITGGTLSDAVRSSPLSPRRAAELLREIAQAIQFAHEHGVIHRDLKPSNILLEAGGRPRVADFGLAKRVDADVSLTASGDVIGTPGYMPPEQAGGDGSATIASDVYGLGSILFYLLAGQPPFTGEDAVGVIYRVVHEEPRIPDSLRSSVPLDLQTIALKCLSKRPEDRYETAAAVARELTCYLNNEPIAARPPGNVERIVRWSRRHPAIAVLGAVTLIAVITGTSFSAYFGILASQRSVRLESVNQDLERKEREARQYAESSRREAENARRTADESMEMLETWLYELEPLMISEAAEQEDRRVLLNKVLDRISTLDRSSVSRDRLLLCEAGATLGLADVTSQLGGADGSMGTAAATPLFNRAIDQYRSLLEADPDGQRGRVGLARALNGLGDLQADSGEWTLAAISFREASNLIQQLLLDSPDDWRLQIEFAMSEVYCAEVFVQEGNLPAAGQILMSAQHRTLAVIEQHPEDDAAVEQLLHVCLELGDWYLLMDDFEQAESSFQRMQTAAESILSEKRYDTGALLDRSTAFERLGDVRRRQGDRDEAVRLYTESLRNAEMAGGTAPGNASLQWEVSFSYQKLADALISVGRHHEAREHAQMCVDIREPLAIADPGNRHSHAKLLHALNTLARACERDDDPSQALHWQRQILHAVERFRNTTGTQAFATQISAATERISALEKPGVSTTPTSEQPVQTGVELETRMQ